MMYCFPFSFQKKTDSCLSFVSRVCLFSLLFLCSCGPEEIDLVWTEQSSGVDTRLNAVFFTDENRGYAVGGKDFALGVLLETNDAGQSWQVDSLTDKEINALDFSLEGRGHNAGIKGLLRSDAEVRSWWLQGLALNQSLPTMNDLSFYSNHKGVIVGGAAFQDGFILLLGADYSVVAIDSFENEISTVTFSDENTVHALGYGIVLRSTDGGLTWERNEVKSDFYRSVHFPSANVGYAVGYVGTILKTTDAGVSWEKLRNGDKIFVGDKPFRSVFFSSEEQGYIVGDNGLFWTTSDGGEQWKEVRSFPDVDLHDVFVINGRGYIVGAEGRIFHFVD
ncbi:MAG: hypothetical protein AAF985_10140 [Bacteroidota bacterium]